ncbi:MAG: Mpo1-like protein [Pseudomonadota bacterium]
MSTTTAPNPDTQPRRVDELLAHYGESHQNPRNELIHFIAIPLIMLSLVGMMFALHPWVAYVFVAASMVYYARLSLVFLLTMVVFAALMFAVLMSMGASLLPLCVAIFVGAWILQFIGHRIEGKKPSFFEDIQYLWVGPLFVVSKLFIKLGIRW